MKRTLIITASLLLLLVVTASAHDMFLKFDSYFLKPQTRSEVRLLNGEFNKSENVITRDRMRDVSLISPSALKHPPESDWRDEGEVTVLSFQTGEAGTYVVGISTKPKELSMKAADFNRYLRLEGVIDSFNARRRAGQLDSAATERYSKHVKAIFQVGDARTETYRTQLGYPVEIIPQQNPFQLKIGETLEALCVRDGMPIVNQYVLYGRESAAQQLSPQMKTRTDAKGIARIPLGGAGRWYIKFIHMQPVNEPPVNYESNWATLTFEVKK